MSIRRLVIINDYSFGRGGATALALLCAELMHDAGVRVTYISGDDGAESTLRARGIDHVALAQTPYADRPRLSGAVQGIWNKSAQRGVADWIARNDDAGTVYHLHGWHSILSPSIFSVLEPVGARALVHAHDFFLVCPNGGFMNFPRGDVCGLRPMSTACVLSNCDRRHYSHKLFRLARQVVQDRVSDGARLPMDVVMIHPRMERFFARSGIAPKRLVTLHNPCLPFSPTPIDVSANQSFFFVGRLDEEKGALDFAASAHAAGVSAVVIGDGPQREQIARDYPSVQLLGWCSRSEIAEHIQRARCVVMPSRYPEPFGLVAVEALGSGVPVIASSHSFLAHDIVEKGMGEALDTRDHVELAATLRRLAADDVAIKAMGERGLAGVGAISNSREGWRDALIRHYQRLIAGELELPRAAE